MFTKTKRLYEISLAAALGAVDPTGKRIKPLIERVAADHEGGQMFEGGRYADADGVECLKDGWVITRGGVNHDGEIQLQKLVEVPQYGVADANGGVPSMPANFTNADAADAFAQYCDELSKDECWDLVTCANKGIHYANRKNVAPKPASVKGEALKASARKVLLAAEFIKAVMECVS